jgi:hypothetical protein
VSPFRHKFANATKMVDEGDAFAVHERYYDVFRFLTSEPLPFSNALALSRDKFFEPESKLSLITAMAIVFEIRGTGYAH